MLFTVIGLKNYAVILHGYYENNYITQYNVKQLENWNGDSYVVLYRYPQEYSMYRNLSMSDPTDYSGVITRWIRRYYGISDSVYFIWEDMGKNLGDTTLLETGSGIYPTETMGETSWNWAKKDSTLNLYNFYQDDRDVILKLNVETPQSEDGKILVTINDKEYTFEVKSHETEIEIPLTISKGQTNVFITADVEQVDSGEDSRQLYMKIIDKKLIEE